MQITKEFLDNEIASVKQTIEQADRQLVFIRGSLNVIEQLRAYLDKEDESEDEEPDAAVA